MNKDNFAGIKTQLVPNDEVMESLYSKIENEVRNKKGKASLTFKKLVPLFCCFAILILAALAYNSNMGITPNNPDASLQDTEIRGISVKDFVLDGKTTDKNEAMDRSLIDKISVLFEYDIDYFLIVKAEKTQTNLITDKQSTTARILDVVYDKNNDFAEIPKSIKIKQSLYGGCTGDEATWLMAEGGVYLLPVMKYEGEYFIWGDLDFLFEIDDKGKIFSHSRFEGMNKYDNKEYTVLSGDIRAMANDEDFLFSVSPFARTMKNFLLVQIRVKSEGILRKSEYDIEEIAYNVKIEKLLGGINSEYEYIDSEIEVIFYADDELILEEGKNYLLFLDIYNGEYLSSSYRSARIDDDGTLKVFDLEGPLSAYDSAEIELLEAAANRVSSFKELF